MPLPLILFLRLAAPLLLFIAPLPGVFVNIILDVMDFHPFGVTSYREFIFYTQVDKLFDLYLLTFILLVARTWKEAAARYLAYFFYFYRLVGYVVFLFLNSAIAFLFYPNFLETFFIFYLLFRLFEKKQPLFALRRHYFLLLPLLFPKLLHELTYAADYHAWIALLDRHRDPVLAAGYVGFIGLTLFLRFWNRRGK